MSKTRKTPEHAELTEERLVLLIADFLKDRHTPALTILQQQNELAAREDEQGE